MNSLRMAGVGFGMARFGLRMTCVRHGMAHTSFGSHQPRNRQHWLWQGVLHHDPSICFPLYRVGRKYTDAAV